MLVSGPKPDSGNAVTSGVASQNGVHGNGKDVKPIKRSRSRAGCLTCRKRRKLCNQQKPVCALCDRLSLPCHWPGSGGNFRDIEVPRIRKRGSKPETQSTAMDMGQGPSQSQGPAHSHNQSQSQTQAQSQVPIHNPDQSQNQSQSQVLDLGSGGPSSAEPNFDPTAFQPFPPDPFGEVGVDQYTLQQWAAELLDCGPTLDPWFVNDTDFTDASSSLPIATSPDPLLSPLVRRPTLNTDPSHRPLLTHYQDCLSRLVACNPNDATNGFDAFTTLASATASTPSGRALNLATLAWAGCHMSNQGQSQYEARSERVAEEAKTLLFSNVQQDFNMLMPMDLNARFDKLAVLGGLLMLMSFKICRGDIWGYKDISQRLGILSSQLFDTTSQSVQLVASNKLVFGFFENLFYHDIMSTSALLTPGPLVSTETLEAIAQSAPENANTLMGTSLRLFCLLRKALNTLRTARTHRAAAYNDEGLADVVKEVRELEQNLEAEKIRYAELVKTRSETYFAWQYMHEGYRVAALLVLHAFVLDTPPQSTQIRLLVRQALSLLEIMYEQDLPGFCSAHFVIFTAGLCAASGGVRQAQMDDRKRVERLYENTIEDLNFKNVDRSRHIVRQVWERNQDGRLSIDWLEIVEQYEWELYLV